MTLFHLSLHSQQKAHCLAGKKKKTFFKKICVKKEENYERKRDLERALGWKDVRKAVGRSKRH